MGGSAMINKFHVLYVGQIELDNVGLNGTPANERRYSDERLREAFFTARDVAQTMDELGLSARAYDKVRRVARTIADLEDSAEIQEQHIAEAVQYRLLDRRF